MNETINRLSTYIKRRPWLNLVISILLGGFLVNIISNLISEKGGYLAISIIGAVILIIFLILFGEYYIEERERRNIMAKPTSEPLKTRYRGLIACTSKIKETKEEIIKEIDSIKNFENEKELKKIYEIRGVGQTFRAIKHHFGKLEVCWLLYTEPVQESKELVEYFIKKIAGKMIVIKAVKIGNPNKIEEVYRAINKIYTKDLKEFNLEEKDVIADVTGGTSIMSSAITLSCISPDRNLEYVEQKTYSLIKIDENISEVIFKR